MIIEDRHNKKSVIIASRLTVSAWYETGTMMGLNVVYIAITGNLNFQKTKFAIYINFH